MSAQLPPTPPRDEHPKSRREPTIAVVLLVLGVNKQLKMPSKHVQASSLGVGGSEVDASQVELLGGQLGNWVLPADDLLGTVGSVALPY